METITLQNHHQNSTSSKITTFSNVKTKLEKRRIKRNSSKLDLIEKETENQNGMIKFQTRQKKKGT